jgi:hypothetical protein
VAKDPFNNLWMDPPLRVSDAFRTLSRGVMLLLHDFYGKKRVRRKGHSYQMLNNSELTFSYVEAEKMGYSKSGFMRYRNELIDHGFLVIAETGAGLYKSANLYALSNEWKKFGRPEFGPQKRESRRDRYPGFKKGHPHYPGRRG